MEEEKNKEDLNSEEIENQETKDNKVKSVFSKIGKGFISGAKKVGSGISSGIEKAKNNIEEHNREKELERSLEEEFNKNTTKLNLVIPNDKKNKVIKLNCKIDYDLKTIAFYGERTDINTNCFFIDHLNQKYAFVLIRMTQSVDIEIDSTIYRRKVTVVEFKIEDDENTKNQMQTIINNNITINDSVIKKSNIG